MAHTIMRSERRGTRNPFLDLLRWQWRTGAYCWNGPLWSAQ